MDGLGKRGIVDRVGDEGCVDRVGEERVRGQGRGRGMRE